MRITVTSQDRAAAEQTFKFFCATCHGDTGKGDGPGAAALDPKPRTFSEPAWQDSVTDDHIKKVITLGGAAVGMSDTMTAQPQLRSRPQVLEALVQKIRAFGGR